MAKTKQPDSLIIEKFLSQTLDSIQKSRYTRVMHEQTLIQAGLSKNQAILYEILLKTGQTTAGKLAQQSPLKRGLTYKILDELTGLGLVEKREELGKVTQFLPLHPFQLKNLAERKEQEAQSAQVALEQLLPNLISDFRLASGKPAVAFFEGVEGMKAIYEDTLKEQSSIYAIVATDEPEESLGAWLRKVYVKKRVARGNRAFVIASSAEEATEYRALDEKELRETVIVPKHQFPFQIEIDIYGTSKTAFISFGKDELMGVIIESPAIHNTMKAFFQLCWSSRKPASTQTPAAPSAPASPSTPNAGSHISHFSTP